MPYEHVLVEKRDRIVYVTLNRPEVLNALNDKLVGELGAVFDDVADDPSVGVLILTGAGEKAFAAGADIQEISGKDALSGLAMAERGQRILRRLETMPKPSIAAVNGFALGGGCEISMACAIRIASEKAKFGQPEVNLGIIPGYAGTQRLPRLVGRGVAMELILTGRIIDAAEALRIGLVTQVVPPEELMATAEKVAKALLGKGPLALRAAMDAVNHGFDVEFDDACKIEANMFGVLCATKDMKEGTEAFLKKRKPEFTGE
ncbi:MAG: enoyl-CoA hydratase/isomerase family protein [Candidatus Latescibacterota bacterium]|nr:MAG: enoyl-CoA hydratase/isomerase family protein [Candidatus Latescibacterota bacterium]